MWRSILGQIQQSVRNLMIAGLLVFLFPSSSWAEGIHLESLGIRGGVSGSSPIGREEAEFFQGYDVMANWLMPWDWYSQSGWGVATRVMTTMGGLTTNGESAFIATVVPGFIFGKKDGWLSLEVGGGGALLSRYQFPEQNMGGTFQFVWDTALRAKVYKGVGLGYWFHHMSDASLYGSDAHGVDLHMIEIGYRF